MRMKGHPADPNGAPNKGPLCGGEACGKTRSVSMARRPRTNLTKSDWRRARRLIKGPTNGIHVCMLRSVWIGRPECGSC